jgi:3-deoxy-D-manno-octulosonic-acid transferase
MPATPLAYRALVRLGAALTPALALTTTKLREGHAGRRGAERRLRQWAQTHRDPARRLVWFHASSVGEGLQAESVLGGLRVLLPHAQYVYTHFSPSATGLARRLPVDMADYLPYDLPGPVERVLRDLTPDLLVFSKLDLWPELATRASGWGVGVAMIAATVSPGSGRLRRHARWLLRGGYRAVDAAGAVSADDGSRLEQLGVFPEAIHVLGDPRFDSVAAYVRAVPPDDPLLRFGAGAPTLVAGSTWPADEAVVLPAFARVRARYPEARLILVPHEPTEAHLAAAERMASRAGLAPPVRLSLASEPAQLLLVDRVGVLAKLYGAGTMAFVGGGFGRAGLHSVLEPAAWSVPVVFGPRCRESRDAGLLLGAGGAIALPAGAAAAVERLAEQWDCWIRDGEGRRAQGERAGAVVRRGRGAAKRSAEMLAELISSRPPRTSPSAAR